ncbi:MAG: hypothetical protein RBT49_09545 [Bacteroidales bacterium]|jgi:hypothetical protein|nr:hypothetical protein [Bacteroidales bacterium]
MISGIFSTLLGICSGWFLYIFIDPSVNNKAILKKRNKQISLLQKLDKWNTYYNYNQLVQIVYDGIVKRYGITPAQVLDMIYKKATAISGIAGLEDLNIEVLLDDEEIKQLPTYQDSAGNIYDSNTNQLIKDSSGNMIRQNKNFWHDLGSIVEWLVKILKLLGLNLSDKSMQPAPADWSYYTENKSEANIAGSLPIVVGGVILYYLFSTAGKKSGKSKK